MKITPIIPDGYNGPIKQLTCRICKHLFYISRPTPSMTAQHVAPHPLLAVGCILASVDLERVAGAKARQEAAGKVVSDETIEAEMDLMYQEQKLAKLKSSPLFQSVGLLMCEQQEWSGTAKQFKEILLQHAPDAFKGWYRAPGKFVEELGVM